MKGSELVWDACGLVNLAATDRVEEILAALGSPSYVVQRVREQEVIYLRPMPEEESDALQSIDLSPVSLKGTLQDIFLTETEQETFVDMARQMDDGKAMTLAAAIHRQFALVTDDRVAKRVARSLSHPIEIVTTPTWVKQWAEKTAAPRKMVSAMLRRITIRARYRPHTTDPLHAWWSEHLGET